MISIIITSYKEPRTIGKAIESFLEQKIKEKYELLVVCPDELTIKVIKKYVKKYPQVKHILDEGRGKSAALNKVIKIAKGDVLILSDGDVFSAENSVNKISEQFKDNNTGCVSGHPLPQNPRDNLFGYWSHLLCYAAHKLREKRAKQGKFLECSGYLWAFRNKIIKKFPENIAEDMIVPILFFLKNYKIKYSPEARVYVKFPDNLQDFIKQKRRAIASHETLYKFQTNLKIPRMKTLFNEISGSLIVLSYPKTLKEVFYTMLLFPIRLYIWLNLFYNTKIRKKYYKDAWQPIKSTK